MSQPVMTIEKAETTITFTRELNAPRELVFEALSQAEHIKAWWGPDEWPVTECTLDFKLGGVWHYCMKNAAGEEIWVKAIYREIVQPDRIVYLNGMSDAAGNEVGPTPPALVTITLLPTDNNKTTLRLHIAYASAEDLETYVLRGMAEGYGEVFTHLDTYIQTVAKN